MRGELVVPLNRGVSPFAVLCELKKIVRFEGTVTPIPLYITNDRVGVYATPVRLLEEWYTARLQAATVTLKYRQDKLLTDYRKAEALLILKDNTEDIQKTFRESAVWQEAIPPLSKKYKLTMFQVKYLSDITFKQTSKSARADLLNNLELTKVKLDEHKNRFMNIHDILIDNILKVQSKYKAYGKRNLVIPKFNTSVVFTDGVIQTTSKKETKHISEVFKTMNHIILNHNPKYNVFQYAWKGTTLDTNLIHDFHKEYRAERKVFRGKQATSAISLKGGRIKKVPITSGWDKDVTLTDELVILLHVSGKFVVVPVDEIGTRRRADTLAVCDEYTDGDFLLGYMNSKNNNILHMMRCNVKSKIVLPVMGDNTVVYLAPIDKVSVLEIPSNLRFRCPKSHMIMSQELLGNKASESMNIKRSLVF